MKTWQYSSLTLSLVAAWLFSSIPLIAQPGSLDSSFQFATSSTVFPSAIAVQADGRVLIGGGFSQVHGQTRNSIARLNPDGSLDASFLSGNGAQQVNDAITLPGGVVLLPASTQPGAVNSMDIQSDGKIVVVGNFNRFNGAAATNLARLNPDGTVDSSFSTGSGLDGGATWVKLLPSGKILVSGAQKYRGITLNQGLARILPDGTLDQAFKGPLLDFGGTMSGLQVQPGGKIVGAASYLNSSFRLVTQIVRLNEDGSLDSSFNRGTVASGTVTRVQVQPEGGIIVSGIGFTQYEGTPVSNIFRLQANGAIDSTFDAGGLGKASVNDLVVDNLGQLVLSRVQGAEVVCVRLLPNGLRDQTFAAPPGYGSYWLRLQADGKILISGNRVTGGTVNFGVYRLNGGGSATLLPPVISVQPKDQIVKETGAVVFSVIASGSEPLSYQWSRDNREIAGATAATYSISRATPADAGSYSVSVRNAAGSVGSTPATLVVTPTAQTASLKFSLESGNAIRFEWPTGYALQAAPVLDASGWTDLGSTSPLSVPTTGDGRFFRLIKR